MLPPDQAIIVIIVMLLFGFANVFFGRDLFRPLLGVYGFAIGVVATGAASQSMNAEPSILAMLVVGGIIAALSFAVLYIGIVALGAGVGIFIIISIANALGTEPALLLLVAVGAICGVLALLFHDYVLMFGTAIGGSLTIAQAIYMFFPTTRVQVNILDGIAMTGVPTAAYVIGALVIVALSILGTYVQWKSYQEHAHQDY